MKPRALFCSFVALAACGALVLACGDDDDSNANGSPDGGVQTPDSGANQNLDSGTSSDDAGADANPDAPAAAEEISPLFTVKIPDAQNAFGTAMGSDGKFYVSGGRGDAGARTLAVWRFTQDGELDATFGTQGVLTLDIEGDEASYSIAEIANGNFVVHANAGRFVYLVKLNKAQDGSYSFGTPKKIAFGWPECMTATSAGECAGLPGGTALPSYSSWGFALDKSSATTKIVIGASGMAPKGSVKADNTTQRTDTDRWITRVLVDDDFTIDPAFNGGQPYSTDMGDLGRTMETPPGDQARRAKVLSDGSIIASGYTVLSGVYPHRIALVKLTAAGTPDTAFSFGETTLPGQGLYRGFASVDGTAEAYDVVEQPGKGYVTAGYGRSSKYTQTIANDFISFRFRNDGLDPTYGDQGSLVVQSETDPQAVNFGDFGRGLEALPDGRIVFAGQYDGSAALFVASENGTLDETVGVDGRITYNNTGTFQGITVAGKYILAAATAVTTPASGQTPASASSLFAVLKIGN